MNFEILPLADRRRRPGHRGFAIRRLDDGMWYIYSFPTQAEAERLVYTLTSSPTHWTDAPSRVFLSLRDSLVRSIEKTPE